MSEYEIVRNPSDKVWREIVDLTLKDEHWTLGYQDYAVWLEAFGQDGFVLFAAIQSGTNEVVGSVSLAAYGEDVRHPSVMTVGMFYVRPDHRGKSIGLRLFDELMLDANARGGNVALNGVLKMSPRYAIRHKFDKFGPWHPTPVSMAMKHVDPSVLQKSLDVDVVTIEDVLLKDLNDYDLNVVGIARPKYINALLRNKMNFHKIAKRSGQIVGFAMARAVAGECLSVGPFYAEDDKIASTVLRALLESVDLSAYKIMLLCIPTSQRCSFNMIDALSQRNATKHDYMASQFTDSVIATKASSIYATTEYAMSFA